MFLDFLMDLYGVLKNETQIPLLSFLTAEKRTFMAIYQSCQINYTLRSNV
jgi:hypothetical protein